MNVVGGHRKGTMMDDTVMLIDLNERFIEACRQGNWPMLRPILSESFVELHGMSGAVTDVDAYAERLAANPSPQLVIDDVSVHIDGDSAVVSARTYRGVPGAYGRYADTYARRGGSWVCTHATVWRLPVSASDPEIAAEASARAQSPA